MAHIVSNDREIPFSNVEWNYLLQLILDQGFFERLPRPMLDRDLVRAQIIEYESEKGRDKKVDDKMAEWDKMSKWDQYHQKDQRPIITKEGAKTWVEILESILSILDKPSYIPPVDKPPSVEYFSSSEGKDKLSDLIAFCREGGFSISYRPEEPA